MGAKISKSWCCGCGCFDRKKSKKDDNIQKSAIVIEMTDTNNSNDHVIINIDDYSNNTLNTTESSTGSVIDLRNRSRNSDESTNKSLSDDEFKIIAADDGVISV